MSRHGPRLVFVEFVGHVVRRVWNSVLVPLGRRRPIADGVIGIAEGKAADYLTIQCSMGGHEFEAIVVAVVVNGSGERGKRGTSSSDRCATTDFVVRVVEAGDRPIAGAVVDGRDEVSDGFVDAIPGVARVRSHP